MLNERFFAILCVVFVNALVITSWSIEATADQYQDNNEENLENELQEDGPWYNRNLTDTGPISKKVFEIQQNLTFLGFYNAKYWYIDRTQVNQNQAIANCTTLGMKIAEPTQEELNFLYNVTAAGDNNAWLGGKFQLTLASFKWSSDDSIPRSSSLYSSPSYGLAFYRVQGTSRFYHRTEATSYFYICTI